jgi:hypothetical protein
MAFYAATVINLGNGNYLQPGDEVTGLTEDQMRSLWDNGALTQQAPEKQAESYDAAVESKPNADKPVGQIASEEAEQLSISNTNAVPGPFPGDEEKASAEGGASAEGTNKASAEPTSGGSGEEASATGGAGPLDTSSATSGPATTGGPEEPKTAKKTASTSTTENKK